MLGALTDQVLLHAVEVRAAPCAEDRFTHRLVFRDLESKLAAAGIAITSAPREAGRGTPIALRVRLQGSERLSAGLVIPAVDVLVQQRGDTRYTHRLVLRGVVAALQGRGVRVDSMESGARSFEELEIRVKARLA
jgi:hypothetical protein